MQSRTVAVLVATIVTLAGMSVGAHHSWNTVFSEQKPLILRGTISKVELVNQLSNPAPGIGHAVKGGKYPQVFTDSKAFWQVDIRRSKIHPRQDAIA